ncbi:MAG: transcription elongation factor GreA [Sulfurimonas sp. RIFOXYD12_FULL_33_39]|uniref:transcription elongation factor GreA n=1 Tax=unclassified Sulfurimonas TaxID=2623549 RepID=UPI0008AABB02|nr:MULTISPECIES: transcription elongation factor GreA [unclassified Sulfurimonas]OHE06276.1 MAG: transcription elongation factor GreA [Sulfurimonas sp. RIFCSPLOWO2_12_FULL_34_6]OHE10245.1 MAG: transcription elongation factor GreA [Sulfurimonas sp. RIFOXYD12_FULL_33_39]OHE14534.1 MAG: transcription elongation factor GreA [Sulfurimonas sp. RIFOXYD2_FULL_34_21]DAB27917.1 MAG TPA: transcription elongation factor GreA [Sulfurimonas sp. UBA10385]
MEKIEPMTLFGYNKLQAEVKNLKEVKRPRTIKDIEEALEHGDLKENAEYHAAKEQQKLIDLRLAELAELIGSAKIVNPSDLEHTKVSFGSTVVVCDVNSEEEFTYTIVGGCESNPDMGLISFNSPLAKQLLGREEGDDVKVQLPNGQKEFEVVEIRYQEIVFECN